MNGSPFLQVDGLAGGFALDDNLLPEEYANPNGSGWVDSYVLQTTPAISSDRAVFRVAEAGNYSTAIDSVALGVVAPGTASLYTEEGGSSLLGVSADQPVVAAHDGSGANVTALLDDPAANATTSAGSYYAGTSGEVVVGGFGNIPQADQDVLLLRASQDPGFPPALPSGITVEVQNPDTGAYTTVGFVAPRELWSTEAIPLSSALPTGTQPVVVRLIWQGQHGLAWLALGEGVSTVAPAPATLVSAISGQGWNWTSLLAVTDGVDAYFSPGDYATLTFGLPFAPPAGSSYVVITNGAPWTTPTGDPQAAFTISPSVPVTNRSVTFTSTSWDNGSTIVAAQWDFGNGSTASGNVTQHVFAQPGWYNVTLNVTDAAGLTSSLSRMVLIYPLWDWQSPSPAWNSGNLCSVQTRGGEETCQNSHSNRCSPALQYNFSADNSTIAIGLSGSSDCAALNFLGHHDTIYLNVSGSNWPYLDLALAGANNRLEVDLSGSGSTGAFVLYSEANNYSLLSSGSHNTLRTILVSADLPADAAPAGMDAKYDHVSLSASGSNNEQNITWVSFPGPTTAVHTTALAGSGHQNSVNWRNITVFAASWASPLNTSCTGHGSGDCCQQGWGQHCCGWQGGGQGGGDRNCCGWWGGHGGQGRCCWGPDGQPLHCCWGASGGADPDHGCRSMTPAGVSSSPSPQSLAPGSAPPCASATASVRPLLSPGDLHSRGGADRALPVVLLPGRFATYGPSRESERAVGG